jgi:hypothetical protein
VLPLDGSNRGFGRRVATWRGYTPHMCRKRKIRVPMHENLWVILACSGQHTLPGHTASRSRCIENGGDVPCRPIRSASRRQVLRPAAAILPQPASGCFGTPWQSQRLGGVAVPIGELPQETAADRLLQKPLEWQSFAWCFECPRCSIESPLCRLAPPQEPDFGTNRRSEVKRCRDALIALL